MVKSTDTHFVERRSGKDRRKKRFRDIIWLFKKGGRRHVRRLEDRRKLQMLDHYPPKLLVLIVIALLFSIVDALLTLWLIDNGAVELNPVMDSYIKMGPEIFMATKFMLTVSVAIIGVLLHYTYVRFFMLQFSHVLNLFAGCFVMVVLWELFLIMRFVI